MDYNPFNIANPNHIFVLCGPAGTGKTTIGEYLAAVKGWTFLEEDNYLPQHCIGKLAAGQYLDESDVSASLDILSLQAISHLALLRPVLVACSAIKFAHRERMRAQINAQNSAEHKDIKIHFVFMSMDIGKAEQLVALRKRDNEHFSPVELVRNHYAVMDIPTDWEVTRDTWMVSGDCDLKETKVWAWDTVNGMLTGALPVLLRPMASSSITSSHINVDKLI